MVLNVHRNQRLIRDGRSVCWAHTFKYSSWIRGRRCWQNIRKALAGFLGALGSLSLSSLIFLLLFAVPPDTLAATAAIVLSPSPCAANKGWMADNADCLSLPLLRAGEGASLSEPPGYGGGGRRQLNSSSSCMERTDFLCRFN